MTPNHKIKHAAFDLSFCSKTVLLQENALLGSFVTQKLLPVVDEVLSERALEDHVIHIDKLNINLGLIRLVDFQSRLARQLRRQLDSLLQGGTGNLAASSGAQARIVPLTRRRLDLVTHFLQTGSLPVTFDLAPGWPLDRCLKSVLEHEPSGFHRFLHQTLHRPRVIGRLVRQFSEDTLRKVVRLLARAQSDAALEAVDRILRRGTGRSASGRPKVAPTILVWALLLDYLLQNSGEGFSRIEFDRWIRPQLKRRALTAQESPTAAVIRDTARPPQGNDALAPGDGPQPTAALADQTRRIIKGYDLYEALRFYLRHGVLPWPADSLPPDVGVSGIVHDLCRSYPDKLHQLAADLQHAPDLCYRLANQLSPKEIQVFINTLLTIRTPGSSNGHVPFIQSISAYADRAADRTAYFAAILRRLVSRRRIDLPQNAAQPHRVGKTKPQGVTRAEDQDPDVIRAILTAILKSDEKPGVRDPKFSCRWHDLQANHPAEFREYLVWLAADHRRLTALIAWLTPRELNKALEGLAGFPALDHRVIATMEALPAEAVKLAHLRDRAVPTSHPNPSAGSALTDRRDGEDESALIGFLTGGPSADIIADATAKDIFRKMIRRDSKTFYAALLEHLKDGTVRQKIIDLLPENWRVRLSAGLRPDLCLAVQKNADRVTDTCLSRDLFDRPERIVRLKWEFILTELAQNKNRAFRPTEFVRRLVAFLADRSATKDKGAFQAVLANHLPADKSAAPHAEPHDESQPHGSKEDAPGDLKEHHAPRIEEALDNMPEAVAVENAGMVLAAPYLPQLWKMLGLIEGGAFKDLQAAERAVHLLQFMVDRGTDTPEYKLVLNKVLCGLDLYEPVVNSINVTAEERKAVDGLIRGMIGNWKAIGRTSIAGFRESFLQRQGRLVLKDDAWHLKVAPRAFDMLLDGIPWGFATIKHSWMARVLYVKWR